MTGGSEVRCGEVFRETATGVDRRVVRAGALSVTLAPVRAVEPTVLVSLERLGSEFERLLGIVA